MPSTCRALAASLWLASSAAAQSSTSSTITPLKLGRTVVEIGNESSGGPAMFGSIDALTFDRLGRIYVLDASDNSVRVFDERGRFIARAGRSGRGPGDFARPLQLYHDGDSTLVVVDEVNGLVLFRTSATEVVHRRTVLLPFRSRAVCVVDRRVFVTGFKNGHTLHALSADFEVDSSFGVPFPAVTAPGAIERVDTVAAIIAWSNRASLLLTCPRAEPRLLTVQGNGPGLRAYRSSGEGGWSTALTDYRGDAFALAGPGRGAIVWGEDATYAVTLLLDSLALLQVARRSFGQTDASRRQVRTTSTSIRSVLIDVRNGRILGETTRLPVIVGAVGNRLAIIESDPYPRVIVREFTVSPR